MSIEIERKFLVKDDSWKNDIHTSTKIKQGYLARDMSTVRVRSVDDVIFLMTIKSLTTGIARTEVEFEIPSSVAKELMEMCGDRVVEKVRSLAWCGDHVWEVDEFLSGKHKGLVLAEVELDGEDQEFVRPEWIGEEVSNDPQYYNSNMV